jgi:hypothetical protein
MRASICTAHDLILSTARFGEGVLGQIVHDDDATREVPFVHIGRTRRLLLASSRSSGRRRNLSFGLDVSF